MMMVKRISYFTFMVAITTIASVGACNRTNASTLTHLNFNEIVAALNENELFDFTFVDTDTDNDYNEALLKILKAKGLKAEALHISDDPSGEEHVVNVLFAFDKNFKGQVSSVFFVSHPQQNFVLNPDFLSQKDNPTFYQFHADIRKDIAQKNLILLI